MCGGGGGGGRQIGRLTAASTRGPASSYAPMQVSRWALQIDPPADSWLHMHGPHNKAPLRCTAGLRPAGCPALGLPGSLQVPAGSLPATVVRTTVPCLTGICRLCRHFRGVERSGQEAQGKDCVAGLWHVQILARPEKDAKT